MLSLTFRQGIVSYPFSGAIQEFLAVGGANVSLTISQGSNVVVAFADGNADYLFTETASVPNAWTVDAVDTWLYWDIDTRTGLRTFGSTILAPVVSSTAPSSPATDQHWFDLATTTMKVWNGNRWVRKIRVFAAFLDGGVTLQPLGNVTGQLYAGTQAGLTVASTPAPLVFDGNGDPLIKQSGTFFTTADQFRIIGAPSNTSRLDSVLLYFTAAQTIAPFTVAKVSSFGSVVAATYADLQTAFICISTTGTPLNDVGSFVAQGVITNPSWNWTTPGASLWITDGGELTEIDLHATEPLTHPTAKAPVARVLSATSIMFDQSLGGKGEKGEKGDTGDVEGIENASTTVAGVTLLSVAPVNAEIPIAAGTNDPRLSDARTPLTHTHTATQVIPTPINGTYNGATVQAMLSQLASLKVEKTGDTMTGTLAVTSTGNQTIRLASTSATESGIEVTRGVQPTAKIVWDETQQSWMYGLDGSLEAIGSGGGGGSGAISDLTDATAANTISNGEFTQNWQWTFDGTSGVGLQLSETALATNIGYDRFSVRYGRSEIVGLTNPTDPIVWDVQDLALHELTKHSTFIADEDLNNQASATLFAKFSHVVNNTGDPEPVLKVGSYQSHVDESVTAFFAGGNQHGGLPGATGVLIAGGNNTATGVGGPVTLLGGESVSDVAGAVSLVGGNSDTGPAGQIILLGGKSNTQDGGTIVMFGGQSSAPNTSRGGDIVLNGGPSVLGVGGDIQLNGGISVASDGGSVLLTGAASGAPTGNGGSVAITAGASTTSGQGGSIELVAGDAATGDGGSISIVTGASAISGQGGSIFINIGESLTVGDAGSIEIASGNATDGVGGNIFMYAGTSATNGHGGVIEIAGGDSADGSGPGGGVNIYAGYGSDGGDIRLEAGSITGIDVTDPITNRHGRIRLTTGGSMVELQVVGASLPITAAVGGVSETDFAGEGYAVNTPNDQLEMQGVIQHKSKANVDAYDQTPYGDYSEYKYVFSISTNAGGDTTTFFPIEMYRHPVNPNTGWYFEVTAFWNTSAPSTPGDSSRSHQVFTHKGIIAEAGENLFRTIELTQEGDPTSTVDFAVIPYVDTEGTNTYHMAFELTSDLDNSGVWMIRAVVMRSVVSPV
jgi:hypothetical protein